MIRFVLLAAMLISINPLCDWLVDRSFKAEHHPTGYTQSERGGMQKLLDRTLAKRKPHMSESEQAAAMLYLWGDAR